MIIINERKKGFSLDRICFYCGEKVESKANFIEYYRIPLCYDKEISASFAKKKIVNTLLSNLNYTENELFHLFNPNYRNEIRRQERETASLSFFSSQDLKKECNAEYLYEFERLHKEMLIEKNKRKLVKNYNHSQVLSFINNDCFVLSRAETEEGGIVYHAYICDGRSAILQHSCSTVRNGGTNKSASGRLNKYLHWKDMLLFKSWGYYIYDWGNTFGFGPDFTDGIDRFKAGFGGHPEKLVSIIIANSFLGKAVLVIDKLFRR